MLPFCSWFCPSSIVLLDSHYLVESTKHTLAKRGLAQALLQEKTFLIPFSLSFSRFDAQIEPSSFSSLSLSALLPFLLHTPNQFTSSLQGWISRFVDACRLHFAQHQKHQHLTLASERDRGLAVRQAEVPGSTPQFGETLLATVSLQRRDRPSSRTAFAVWGFEWHSVPASCIFGPFGGKLNDTGANPQHHLMDATRGLLSRQF